MSISPGTRLGPYEVVAPLGAGGMGEVYRARDGRLGRDVAIKILSAEVAQNAERLKRFEREARAASSLNHPNIVTIYEIGSVSGTAYIVMELVEGETLRSLMLGEPIPTRKLLGIAAQIAEGLAKAHAAGVTHRDLKPENVMVTRDSVVKILDFGLAKLQPSDTSASGTALPTASVVTEPGVIMGTVAYMSPEQARGTSLDFRSDQFSFGALLYEMATGKRAFEGESRADILSAILRDEPQPVASRNPKVPAPLRWIIERCLGKEPKDRYAATEDLARDLATVRDRLSEATTSGPTLAAEPPHWGPRRVAAAVPLATLLLGLIVGWLALRPPLPSTPRFQRVTFRPAHIYRARFAPDGQTIVYGAMMDGRPVEVFTTRLGSRGSRPLGITTAHVWSVSSSGELAVSMGWDDKIGTLARASLGGGAPREILENVSYADWAPDGQSLAVVRSADGKHRLEFPIGTFLCELNGVPIDLRVSPKGDVVALAGGGSIDVVDRAGKRRSLAKGEQSSLWSPDGKEIWFARSGTGTTEVFSVTPGGRERFIASMPGDMGLFDLSRDGRLLVEIGGERWDVVGRLAGDESDRDLSWFDTTIPADVSADGKTLLFSEKEAAGWGNLAVYLRKQGETSPIRLGEGHARSLSPDGKWALCLSNPPDRHLVLIPTGPGETRSLPTEGLAGFSLTRLGGGGSNWLPDAKRIVFTSSTPGHGLQLFVQEVDGGKPRAITPEGVRIRMSGSAVSPDGRFVIGAAAGTYSQYPIDGGTPRPIAGLAPGEEPIRWSADGLSVYVSQPDKATTKIWLLDPATGRRRLFKELRPPGTATSGDLLQVLMTPDGRSTVHTYQRWLSDLYVVEGLR